MVDIAKSIEAKSDRLNADDLISGPRTITIEDVRAGNAESPVAVYYEGCNGKPWYPCKTMRRAMVHVWTDQGKSWVGKSLTLYRDPDVIYGGVKVGGTRISHFSHVESDFVLALSEKRGPKKQFSFKKLVVPTKAAPDVPSKPAGYEQAVKAIQAAASVADLDKMTGTAKFKAFCENLGEHAEEFNRIVSEKRESFNTSEDRVNETADF